MNSTNQDCFGQLLEVDWFKESHLSILISAHFRCEYCGLDFLADFNECFHAQLDHIYPKSKGGSNDPFNLAACCITCNALKWDYAPRGERRKDRILDAVKHIHEQREVHKEKWKKYRHIVPRAK